MGLNVNNVILAGNLTRDPQVRQASQSAVANFGLAVNRKYKASDGSMKEDVVFVDIEAWGRLAETCGQYLTKGKGVYIEGRLKLDSWEDKEGKKQSKLRVVAENVQFLGGGRENGESTAGEQAERPAPLRAPAGARPAMRPSSAAAHLPTAPLESNPSQTNVGAGEDPPF